MAGLHLAGGFRPTARRRLCRAILWMNRRLC